MNGTRPRLLLADTGYFSAKNVEACAAASIEPLMAAIATAINRHGANASKNRRYHLCPPVALSR